MFIYSHNGSFNWKNLLSRGYYENAYNVLFVVYLKSSVEIVDVNATSGNPYILQ